MEKFFTKNLICRKINKNDLPMITDWENSQIAYGDYLSCENHSLEDNIIKFENNSFWNDKSKTYIIETKKDTIPIGTLKYWTKTDLPNVAMMAIKITIPEFRNKGYGTEAQKGMIRELFKKYNYNAIEMYTDVNNIAQKKCLKKLDFEDIKTESYVDAGVQRQGHLFRLNKDRYEKSGVHIFYYE